MNNNNIDPFSSRKNNFDFIRFIAASSVIFSHSYVIAPTQFVEPLVYMSNNKIAIGQFSVMVFFIISGYLIPQSYLRSKSVIDYLSARFLRIIPGLFIVLLVSVFLVGPVVTNLSIIEYFSDSQSYSYLQKVLLFRGQEGLPGVFENNFFKNAVNGSLWTISYEFLMYLFVIVVGLFFQKKYIKSVILIILTVLVFHNLFYKIDLLIFSFYFLLGYLAYYFRRFINLRFPYLIVSLCLIYASFNLIDHRLISNLIITLPVTYIILYISFLPNLRFNDMAKYGDFSYGVYLYGFLNQQILAHFYPSWNNFQNFLIGFLCSLICAFFSWHLIEKKALSSKKILSSQIQIYLNNVKSFYTQYLFRK